MNNAGYSFAAGSHAQAAGAFPFGATLSGNCSYDGIIEEART